MLSAEVINGILGIKESYQAPQKMFDLLLNDESREVLFQSFLKHEEDLSYEWFQSYFEDEHADRKAKKQDFTPSDISKLLTLIGGDRGGGYFESAAGTGGILIQSWDACKNKDKQHYHVEELSERATPFLLFNMAIRGMNGIVSRGDSLTGEFEETYKLTRSGRFSRISVVENKVLERYSTVLMNPPYSAKWSSDKSFQADPRFSKYKRLAPKSKADLAFLLHGFHQLKEDGTMAAVFPHGILFRGAAEGTIRQKLLERGEIYAVIGLPEKLFFNTQIPTIVIVLKKNRGEKDVLFIDASKEFKKGRNQNFLKPLHLEKTFNAYKERENIDKFSYLASYEEIEENDFNLNIPRYVDTFEEPDPIDIIATCNEIMQIDQELRSAESELLSMLNELQVTDKSIDIINATKMVFGGKTLKGEMKMTEAKNKINHEMERVKSSYVQIVGSFLLERLEQDPSIAEKLMQEDKTITGSLAEMRKEAEKQKVGNVAVLSDEEGFAVILKYFGIESEAGIPPVAPKIATTKVIEAEGAASQSSDSVKFNVSLEDLL